MEVRLKIGKMLNPSQSIKVGNKSTVTMICENIGRPITFQQGNYELKKYTNVCKTQASSMTVKYLKYVWWQLTTTDAFLEEAKKIAGVGGGVSRGCGGIVPEILFDTICYYKENFLLRWHTTGSFAKNELEIYEGTQSILPVYTFSLNKNQFSLDSLKGLLQPSTEYYWNILLDDKETCPRKVLQIWSDEDFGSLRDSIKNNMDVSGGNAEKNYMFGYFMELNHFYGEALKYYQAALNIEPTNERYINTVARFNQQEFLNKNKRSS